MSRCWSVSSTAAFPIRRVRRKAHRVVTAAARLLHGRMTKATATAAEVVAGTAMTSSTTTMVVGVAVVAAVAAIADEEVAVVAATVVVVVAVAAVVVTATAVTGAGARDTDAAEKATAGAADTPDPITSTHRTRNRLWRGSLR